ncbi:pheromone processing endoprotease [Sorochytrium milnesiophthora]
MKLLATIAMLTTTVAALSEYVAHVHYPAGPRNHQHSAADICERLEQRHSSVLSIVGRCTAIHDSAVLVYLASPTELTSAGTWSCGCTVELEQADTHEISHRAVVPKAALHRRDSNPDAALFKQLQFKDPEVDQQWYFTENVTDAHIHILPVWAKGITGRGITVMVSDDGVDVRNADLAPAFLPALSHDFVRNVAQLPVPVSEQAHGTKVAGVVAARKNDFCGVGVAYDVRFAGSRILPATEDTKLPLSSDAREAAALGAYPDDIDVYVNSWGPADTGTVIAGPGPLMRHVFEQNTQTGRKGRGSIYMFASGNGRLEYDNCNYDGYANSIYTIAVAALHMGNRAADYSEECPAIMVTTYSSFNAGDNVTAITTTGLGADGCVDTFGGTSAANPQAAGVVALMLQVKPELGWRDVMSLLVHNAVPVDTNDASWTPTYNGLMYSNRYGFGKLDATKLVSAAQQWNQSNALPPMQVYVSARQVVQSQLPAGRPLVSKLQVSGQTTNNTMLTRIEQIQVEVNISSSAMGFLVYRLQSPSGLVSTLTSVRYKHDNTPPDQWLLWNFTTVQYWDETKVAGEWTLSITDDNVTHTSALSHWQLWLYGVGTSAAQQSVSGGDPAATASLSLLLLVLLISVVL